MPSKLIRKTPAPRRTGKPARPTSDAVSQLPHIDASEARKQMAQVLGRVSFGREHIAVDKHGKTAAVMVPLDDYEHYRQLEDYLDGFEGAKALAEYRKSGEFVSSDDVLKKLGIK